MLSIPSAPQVPLFVWWILAVASSVAFYAFYRSVATNRAQEIMPAVGVLVGILGAFLFGVSREFSMAQVLPMYVSAMTAACLGGVGHRETLRRMWRASAEKGAEGARWPRLLAVQFWAIVVIAGGLGVWFAGSA